MTKNEMKWEVGCVEWGWEFVVLMPMSMKPHFSTISSHLICELQCLYGMQWKVCLFIWKLYIWL